MKAELAGPKIVITADPDSLHEKNIFAVWRRWAMEGLPMRTWVDAEKDEITLEFPPAQPRIEVIRKTLDGMVEEGKAEMIEEGGKMTYKGKGKD